jgi:hypothetical protein
MIFLATGVLLAPFLFIGVRVGIHRLMGHFTLPPFVQESYLRYDSYTYGVFLFTLLGALGLEFTVSLVLQMFACFILAQIF